MSRSNWVRLDGCSQRRPMRVERLERRTLLSTFTVLDFDQNHIPYSSAGPVIGEVAGGPWGDFYRLSDTNFGNNTSVLALNQPIPGSQSSIEIEFDFRIGEHRFTGNPADGIAVALVDTKTYGNSGTPNINEFLLVHPKFPTLKDSLIVSLATFEQRRVKVGANGNTWETFYDSRLEQTVSGRWHHWKMSVVKDGVDRIVNVWITNADNQTYRIVDSLRVANFAAEETRLVMYSKIGATASRHEFDNLQIRSNVQPTLDAISNISIPENSPSQTIPISGVTPGGTESQPLRVTATSSLPELIPHPDVRMLRSLDNPTLVTAGNTTRAVTVGDWNGDSHPDIAATNQVAGNLSVSFGNGKGSFFEILSLPMNQAPSFAVADDFNLDGFDDIVVSNSQNNLVTVRLGNAQGTFSPAASFPTGNGDVDPVSSGVHALATGDFNQDGRIDLIATNIIHDFVSILPGNGAGGFGTPVQTLLGPTGNTPPQPDGPSGIVPGDFNRDGFLDAAIAILGNGTVRILLGNGNGNFTSASGYQIGSRAKAIDTADFNGDSILDLAVINDLDSQVTILLGSGSGTFTPLSQLFAGAGSQHITSGDLDQDGRHDLIASATNSRTFLLRGLGNGQFQPPVQLAYDTSERTINNSLVVDLNHDQFPEVVSAISNESQIGAIGVLWNQQATSGLLTLQPLPQQSGTATIVVRVEDPGLDGRFDTPQDNGITTGQFVVTVQPVNDPPTAVDDEATLFVEQSMLLDLLSNDFDLDDGLNPGSIELMQLPQGGTARVSEGKVLYVPNQQQIGVDSFTYRVQDLGGNWSREAVVRLNLLERPVGVDDSVQTPRDTSISIDVTANDRVKMSPIDRTTLTIIQPPLVGTATVTNGMIEFSPPLFYLGEVRFRYLVANNQGIETNPTEVVVTVAGSRLQNILYPVDVNANGTVTAIDALLVINELNLNGSRPVELIAGAAPPFYDVSGDFQVSALDALLVINHLNLFGSGPIGDGEGELSLDATDSTLSIEFHRTDLLHDLALLAWLEDPLRERLTPHRTGNFKGGVHSQPVKGNQSTT
ncbi:MAG: FG-GAP-like repeat-containing protein [Pirellulaceae bacterium]